MTYEAIPGWFNFSRAYNQAIEKATHGAHFVEVGCWAGRSAVYMAEQIILSGKDITFTCVDHWLGSVEHQNIAMVGEVYEVFLRNTEKVREKMGHRFQIIRSESVEAAKRYRNNSLDFVWLDAGHDEASVRSDIQAWLPKVKAGGTLGGDDYPMEGVATAVHSELGQIEHMPENGWVGWRWLKEASTPEVEGSSVLYPAEHPKNISGYKIVHQGGHHDVWCNGSTHIRTDGGYAGINKGTAVNGQFPCNCQMFRALPTPEVEGSNPEPVKRKKGRPKKVVDMTDQASKHPDRSIG